MNSQMVGLRVAAVVFALVCLAQLLRFLLDVEVVAGGHTLPLWPSAIAAVVTGALSYWEWMLSRGGGSPMRTA